MADTPRTHTALDTLFADNATGAISAQDLRDGFQSVDPERYGVFSVMRYGATGDGLTDDTAAIQLAIDTAANTGGIVYFPPGTYIVSKTASAWCLQIKDNVHLRGAGGDSSVIKVADSEGTTNTRVVSSGNVPVTEFSMRDLVVDGNRANGTYPAGEQQSHGVFIYDESSDITIEDCLIKGLEGDGFFAYGNVSHVTVTNNRVTDIFRIGINIHANIGVRVTNNEVWGAKVAISLEHDVSPAIEDKDALDVVIAHNTIFTVWGINVSAFGYASGAGIEIGSVTVSNNTFRQDDPANADDVTYQQADGGFFDCDGTGGLTVTGNTCYNLADHWITLHAGVRSAVIADNVVHGSWAASTPTLFKVGQTVSTSGPNRDILFKGNVAYLDNGGDFGGIYNSGTGRVEHPERISFIGNSIHGLTVSANDHFDSVQDFFRFNDNVISFTAALDRFMNFDWWESAAPATPSDYVEIMNNTFLLTNVFTEDEIFLFTNVVDAKVVGNRILGAGAATDLIDGQNTGLTGTLEYHSNYPAQTHDYDELLGPTVPVLSTAGTPADLQQGMMWMESDGSLHIYHGTTDYTITKT